MHLTTQPVGGFWFVAIVAAVLIVLLARVGPRHVELPFGRKLTLKLLRLVAILLLVFAMLRPTLQFTESTPQEATLLVLIDNSRSMQVEDSLDNRSRWEAVQLVLGEASGDFESMSDNWHVTTYTFAETVEPVDSVASLLQQPDDADGEQSALGAALQELLDREGDERLRGVLILSDGAQRAVPPLDAAPQLVARQYASESIPLYTFAFGQPGGSDRSDLAIEDLLTSGAVFAKAPMRVTGQLRAEGYANRNAKVQLLWENTDGEMEIVDATQQSIVGPDSRTPLSLGYTPETPGEYKLTLRAESPEGELITTNNEASTFVTVREGGIKVLYLIGATRIGGGPGIEQRFVRSTLAESPDLLVTRRPFNYRRSRIDFREELQPDNYDVVMLDNVDKDALNKDSWQALADMVRGGTGLYMGGGHHSFGPGGFRTSPLAGVLPIDIGPAEKQNFRETLRKDVHIAGPIKMQPTDPVGAAHPIMQLASAGRSTELWNEIPPLDGANLLPQSRLKPNAQVLAEAVGAQLHPLLIAGQAGAGRTLAFAGDSTWRWQLEGQGDAHRRFWRQVVLWLAKKDAQAEGDVWIDLATRRVSRGGRIDIEVGAQLGADDVPDAPLKLELTIIDPAGNRQPLATVATAEGRRAGTFAATDQAGDYTAEVIATSRGKELGKARARFLVPTQDLELDRPGAEPALLAQLAKLTAESGGEALAPEELPRLVRDLAREQPELKTEVIKRTTYWDKWPFLILFVAVVGVEWFLRKRWGLV
ncbi:MAG: glutamine amidotransferase [Aeoliella sp.]